MPLLRSLSAFFVLLSLLCLCPRGGAWTQPRAFGQTASSALAPPSRPGDGERVRRRLYVSVVDEDGRFVEGLPPEKLVVRAGEEPTEVVSFTPADVPTSVGVLIDVSGSMFYRERKGISNKERTDIIKAALSRLLEDSHPANDYFVVAFNNVTRELLDVTTDRKAVLASIDAIGAAPFKGQTAFYDACRLGLDKLAGSTKERRALVVISDGADNSSNLSFNKLTRIIKERDVLVYPVAVFNPGDEYALVSQSAQSILVEFAEISGGVVYATRDHRELETMFSHLARGLRTQYALEVGLPPATKKDGWRELKIKVEGPRDQRGKTSKLFARARKGFYLPPDAR